ncbi:hypothetical protein [Tenacibaculum sp. M341]|nr:hypothetical protein [Tenacibaculum sp. M341]
MNLLVNVVESIKELVVLVTKENNKTLSPIRVKVERNRNRFNR